MAALCRHPCCSEPHAAAMDSPLSSASPFKVSERAEDVHALSVERPIGDEGSCFHWITPGFMCQRGDFTPMTALMARPCAEGNCMMITSPWSREVLGSYSRQKLYPTQMVSSFSCGLPRLNSWVASMWSFGRVKKEQVVELWKTMGLKWQAKRLVLPIVNSHASDLCFLLTAGLRIAPLYPICCHYPVVFSPWSFPCSPPNPARLQT